MMSVVAVMYSQLRPEAGRAAAARVWRAGDRAHQCSWLPVSVDVRRVLTALPRAGAKQGAGEGEHAQDLRKHSLQTHRGK